MTQDNISAFKDVHVGLFDLDGLFCHRLMDGRKAAKLAKTGYSFCDVIHACDSAEQQWQDDRPYIDRPAKIHTDTLRRWPWPRCGAGDRGFYRRLRCIVTAQPIEPATGQG